MKYPSMSYKNKGIEKEPLLIIPVNGEYLLAVYKGSLSEYDLLLKYRQMQPDGTWTRIRTPKHIHWAVDILIKMHEDENATRRFVDFLLNYWQNEVIPIRSESERNRLLDSNVLLDEVEIEAGKYLELSDKGEYSVKFLLLIAKLLMIQEKTNREDAYMFGKLLKSLKESKDIFKIVSTATFR